ncbi:MAG: Hemoglobin-like protein HbO, partial [uncultured Rubellimicrobium sp.]
DRRIHPLPDHPRPRPRHRGRLPHRPPPSPIRPRMPVTGGRRLHRGPGRRHRAPHLDVGGRTHAGLPPRPPLPALPCRGAPLHPRHRGDAALRGAGHRL